MSWKTIDRNTPVIPEDAEPVLSEAVREKIRSFFPRYETRRAVLLPALHIVQDALGHVSWQAMKEIAEVLEIPPSNVIDTISFYTHFWTHEKGEKVITVCRSISCEAMGGAELLEEIKGQLGIREHETTPDGKYSLATEECLAGCDHAPCMLIGEKMHKRVKTSEVRKILADVNNAKIDSPRSDLFDAPRASATASGAAAEAGAGADDDIETTSDVQEMKDAD